MTHHNRQIVVAALRSVVGYSVPKHLYHETTIDDLKAIRSEGLVPRVGDIVQTLDSYDEETNLDATFLSDEENEIGGYVIWKVANKLGYQDWSKVTWGDIEEHGLLAIVDIDKHDGDEPVYKYVDDGKIINLDGEEVDYIETLGEDLYASDCCSSPIEQGNWFSYVGIAPDRYVTGKELVDYIKKVSTNAHVKNLMAKTEAALKSVVASKDAAKVANYLKGYWYHGTQTGHITKFDLNYESSTRGSDAGEAVWFSTSEQDAIEYAHKDSDAGWGSTTDPNVVKAKLKVTNPFVTDGFPDKQGLISQGYDSIINLFGNTAHIAVFDPNDIQILSQTAK